MESEGAGRWNNSTGASGQSDTTSTSCAPGPAISPSASVPTCYANRGLVGTVFLGMALTIGCLPTIEISTPWNRSSKVWRW